MPNNILIKPNVPLYISLSDPEGDSANFDFDLRIGRYQTTDGRTLALPEPGVIQLNVLSPRPGEEVQITKVWSGVSGQSSFWSICLSARSEQARAEAGEPDALTKQLEASIEANEQRKATVEPVKPPVPIRKPIRPVPDRTEQPKLFDRRGTGTYGPAPEPAVIPLPALASPLTAAAIRKQFEPIPANVATREILQFIEADPNTKNWSDQAKQDLLSTWIIAFTKTKHIGLWERGE